VEVTVGMAAVVVRTRLEDFTVQVRRGGSRSDGEQLELARWAAKQFRLGMAMGEPAITRAARELVRLLDGDRFGLNRSSGSEDGFGPSRRDVSSTFGTALGGIAARLEEELLAGRLVVERRRVVSLTEERDLIEPELPPLPPPPRDPTTRTFEVRFVDEVGKAISGVDAEFTADGPQTRTTNAAGVALLDSVQSSSAKVAILDAEALSKVLDPRWENFRPGQPPKESNTTEVVFRGGELGPFALKAELPNTVVVKPPLGKLFVELWDKTGRSRHANRTYQITGPQAFEGKTDEDGILLHENVFPGDYQLSLALEFFEEDAPDRQLDLVDASLVVLESSAGAPQVRQIGVVPRSVLARLHASFNTNRTFLLPNALPSVRTLRKLYLDNAPCKLLVVGHADTKGGAAYNDKLSLERARAVIAYLKDDVEAWFAFYSDSDLKKRWGKVEDHLMLIALPDFRSKPPDEDEVEFFQRTRGLKVDGDAGKDTRRALIREYMALDGTSLGDFVGDIEAVAHGCGENFPLDDRGENLDAEPADEKRDHVDRRVEFYFFDNEFGITPAPPGENSKPGSIEYPRWRDRAVEIHDLEVDAAGAKLQLIEFEDVLFDTNSAVPLPQRVLPDGKLDPKGPSAVHDVAAALRFAFAHPEKLLLVAGHTDTTADASINDPLSDKRALTVLAMLTGDAETFKTTADAQNVPADKVRVLEWADAAFALSCSPKRFGGNMDKAIRAFQTSYNASDRGDNPDAPAIGVDGDFGPETWGAVFELLEGELAEILRGDREVLSEYRKPLRFVDDEKRSMGFGERYPVDELGRDNIRSAANRRVEVLFFDPKDKPDLEAPLDLSPIYLPGDFVHEPQPIDPAKLEVLPIKAVRLATRFSDARTFPKPSALPALAQMAKLATEGSARLVIVGHTDHSQKDSENEALALGRAEAVSALLRHDRAFFLQRFDTADPMTTWRWEEVQWMLSALKAGGERCYVGVIDDYPGDLTRRAIGRFQLFSEALEVDYDCNADTLSAMIDAYFALLGTPPVPVDRISTVAGGSWNPRRRFQPDAALEDDGSELSNENRRVDVFAFDEPVVPATETVVPTTRQESPTYVRWCRRVQTELTNDPVSFPIRLFDSGLVPIGPTSIRLSRLNEDGSSASPQTVQASEFGSAEFTGPAGSYSLSFSVQGRSYEFAVSVQPDDIGGFAAILTHDLA
jgi:outer membrane protein OmpA-like peptidoglycan-associated protein